MSGINSNLSLYNSKYLKYKNKYLGLKKMFGGGKMININVTFRGRTTNNIFIHNQSPLMDILKVKSSITRNIFPYYNNKLITEGTAESNGIEDNSTVIIYFEPQPDLQPQTKPQADVQLQTKPQEKLSYKDNVGQIDTNEELVEKLSRYYYNNKIIDANWIYYKKHENQYKDYGGNVNNSKVYNSIKEKYYPLHREYIESLEKPEILKKLLELNIQVKKDTDEVDTIMEKIGKYYHYDRITDQQWKYQRAYMGGDEYKTIRDLYYPKHTEYISSLGEPGILEKLLVLNIQIEEEYNKEYNKEENVRKREDKTAKQKADALKYGWGSQYHATQADIDYQKNRPPPKPCFCRSSHTCNCSSN